MSVRGVTIDSLPKSPSRPWYDPKTMGSTLPGDIFDRYYCVGNCALDFGVPAEDKHWGWISERDFEIMGALIAAINRHTPLCYTKSRTYTPQESAAIARTCEAFLADNPNYANHQAYLRIVTVFRSAAEAGVTLQSFPD